MPNPYFKFKRFSVFQGNSAMKVGTDGVLLGAWVDCSNIFRILDIGTGTGLIALMLAQRSQAQVDAVEIDINAQSDAQHNFSNSPWGNRICLYHQSIQHFTIGKSGIYQLIVCNPPFFKNSLKTPHESRNIARHNDELPIEELLACVVQLLLPDGNFSIIIPANDFNEYEKSARMVNLFVHRKTWVKPTPSGNPKRTLVSFKFGNQLQVIEDELIIEENGRHQYSKEYVGLTSQFYLKF
jgi:tRNA1Val (adenine37-N6)-methyltransferase